VSRRRAQILLAIKIAVGALLIAWLIQSGTLDFGALRLFVDRPELLAANLAVFAFTVVLAAIRWRLLLRLTGVELPFGRAVALFLTGMFFNVVLPGNIGGEVVKALYVIRLAPDKKAKVFLIALLDKLVALAGLIIVAGVLTLAQGSTVWDEPQLRKLTTVVVVLMTGTIVAPTVAIFVLRRAGDRIEAWLDGPSRFARILAQLVAAMRLVAARPLPLVAALGLAVAIHLAGIVLFATLATAIKSQDISIGTLASVYPLGTLTMALPISYSGFGVGHVAFEKLFAIVGLSDGATVLNVYLIGQVAPALLGIVPFLAFKQQHALPTETELDQRR
jgi:glycosyltransferase 2 family protein